MFFKPPLGQSLFKEVKSPGFPDPLDMLPTTILSLNWAHGKCRRTETGTPN